MGELEEFVNECRAVGSMIELVQGAGGNISIKTAPDAMLIKASGLLLKDVTIEKGHLYVDQNAIAAFLETIDPSPQWSEELEARYLGAIRASRIDQSNSSMPSLEAGFHSFLSRAVIHTHPLIVNAYACTNDGQQILRRMFKDAIFVPYATIGAVLSKEVARAGACADDGKPIFLLNHGLITHAPDFHQAGLGLMQITGMLEYDLLRRTGGIEQEFSPAPAGGKSTAVKDLLARGLGPQLQHHAFPDSVVYCSGGYAIDGIDARSVIGEGRIRLYADGTIDASALKSPAAVAEIVHANAYIALAAQHLGGIRPLPAQEIANIQGMASEKYRQRMAELVR
jgi:ribulose-5-phosphate 4-epimerase/fuculose-1-phosphate aldolase